MPKIGRIGRFFLICAGATALFALLIPWNGWNDPDAFYHATMARLLWQSGPVLKFPWLDLTLMGTVYADLHFGFHLFVAPFTAVFGDLQGLRIASVILIGICVATFDAIAGWLRIRWPLVWTILLVTTFSFAFRVSLGKATPLALILFLIGLSVAWKRRAWLVGFCTLVYALSYGGWPFLAGSIILLAFGDALYDLIVHETSWRKAVVSARWREIGAAWAGGFIGLLVHPNFPQDLQFAWAQIVTIGLGTPFQHVRMGTEWMPTPVLGFVAGYGIWVVLLIAGMTGLALAHRERLDEDRARLLVSLGWVMAALVALTLKSRRNTEILAPVVALWVGTLWSLIDPKMLWRSFVKTFEHWPRPARISAIVLICLIIVSIPIKQMFELWMDTHPPGYPDTIFRTSMDAISARATPGDRVFHTSWDEFPELFHADQRLRYVSGLDPTFLYIASSTLSNEVRDVTWNISTSTPAETWSLIHDQLHSKFVFVSRKNHSTFLNRIESDPRYIEISSSTDSAAFTVGNPNAIPHNVGTSRSN